MLVPGTGIHHTSMGSQYANSKYRLALKDYGLIGSMVTSRNRHEQLYADRFFSDVLADRMLLNWIPFQRKEAMSPGVLIHRTTVVNGPHRTPAAAAEGRVCDQSLKLSRNYRQAIKQFLDQQ